MEVTSDEMMMRERWKWLTFAERKCFLEPAIFLQTFIYREMFGNLQKISKALKNSSFILSVQRAPRQFSEEVIELQNYQFSSRKLQFGTFF